MIDPALQKQMIPCLFALGIVAGLAPLATVFLRGRKLVSSDTTIRHEKNPVNCWLRQLDRKLQDNSKVGIRAAYFTESIDWLLHTLPFLIPFVVLKSTTVAVEWFEQYRSSLSLGLMGTVILISGYYWGVADTRYQRSVRRAQKNGVSASSNR